MTQAQIEERLKDAQRAIINLEKRIDKQHSITEEIKSQYKNIDKTFKRISLILGISMFLVMISLVVIDHFYKKQNKDFVDAIETMLIEKRIITH